MFFCICHKAPRPQLGLSLPLPGSPRGDCPLTTYLLFLLSKSHHSFLEIQRQYILDLSGTRKDNLAMRQSSTTSIIPLSMAVTSVMCMRITNTHSSRSSHPLESIHLDKWCDLHSFWYVSNPTKFYHDDKRVSSLVASVSRFPTWDLHRGDR